MAKKRTLRSISSEVPAHEVVERMLLNLSGKDDHAAAMLGASLVESALQQRLIEGFDSRAAGLERSLFENGGPLSDLNSKVLVAQAFALIPDRLADDIHRIRKIRNCFAHARIEVRFDEPLIAQEVAELAAVTASRKAYKNHELATLYSDPKVSFGLSCFITYTMLKSADFASVMASSTSDPSSGRLVTEDLDEES